MVETKYGNEDKDVIVNNIKRLIGQVYRLLPLREENLDWQKPLETIIVELKGMRRIIDEEQNKITFFSLICKLEGLFSLTSDLQFQLYRRTIFEIIGLLNRVQEEL